MPSSITRAEIEKVARLSRLSLTPEEADRAAEQLGAVLDYAAKLNAVDTSGVEPTSHCLPTTNVFRDDVPVPSLTVAEALANAPDRDSDRFRVPPIIQG